MSGVGKPLMLVLLLSILSMSCQSLAGEPACGAEPGCGDRVYVFRGVGGYCPGVQQLADRLRCRGFDPVIRCSAQWIQVRNEILRRRQTGEDHHRVIIIGYSFGAATAVELARALRENSITVDKLLLIECFRRANIPDNVMYCFNIYETRPFDPVFIFRGTPVASVSRRTTLRQINIAHSAHLAAHASDLNHFNMTDCPRVQNLVVSQLAEVPRH